MICKRIIPYINKIQILILCILAVSFIFIGYKYYQYEAEYIQNDKYEDLSGIVKVKIETILDWRKNRLADARRVSQGPLVRMEIARLLQNPADIGSKTALKTQLKINRKDNLYEDALFADIKGNILLSDNIEPVALNQSLKNAIEIAIKNRKETLSEIYKSSKGSIYIDAVAPIQDDSGQVIAFIVLRTNTSEFLYPFIQSWPTHSDSAESFILCRDGDSVLFLNELRHRSGTALTLRFPLTKTELPAVQAVLGKTGRFRSIDYRGKDVLAILEHIPQTSWHILSKVDADEILAELSFRARAVFIIVFLLNLIIAGAAFVIYKKRAEAESRKREEILQKSLSEKETLIRELYHRTKNTMMVIVSIMGLNAAKYPENARLQEFVNETVLRIQAISVVHQMLYRSNDLSKISIEKYIIELSTLILKSFGSLSENIKLEIKIDKQQFFVLDTAIPLGIILNELMTNSIKYAFPDNRPGKISISLNRSEENKIIFCYCDDGIGVTQDFDFHKNASLGLQLIFNIGEQQMQGIVSFENKNGISFSIEFPDNIYKERV